MSKYIAAHLTLNKRIHSSKNVNKYMYDNNILPKYYLKKLPLEIPRYDFMKPSDFKAYIDIE